LRPGSGFGLGFGAFLTSFLPLSLLPIVSSVTQMERKEKTKTDTRASMGWYIAHTLQSAYRFGRSFP
jgi:hypothetical protein